MRRYLRQRQGVTLVELLVSMIAFSVLMLAVTSAMTNVMNQTQPALEATARVSKYQPVAAFIADQMSFAQRPLILAEDERLEFVTVENGLRRHYMIWRDCADQAIYYSRQEMVANLLPNPSFEVNATDGWTPEIDNSVPSGEVMTVATSGTDAEYGANSVQVTWPGTNTNNMTGGLSSDPIPVSAGQQLVVGGSYRSVATSSGVSIRYEWLNVTGDPLNEGGGWTERVGNGAGWVTRSVLTEPAPKQAASMRVRLWLGDLVAPGSSARFDGIFVSTDPSHPAYVDGDSFTHAYWTGTRHNSASIMAPYGPTPVIGFSGGFPGSMTNMTAPEPGNAGELFARKLVDIPACPGTDTFFTYYGPDADNSGNLDVLPAGSQRLTNTIEISLRVPTPLGGDDETTEIHAPITASHRSKGRTEVTGGNAEGAVWAGSGTAATRDVVAASTLSDYAYQGLQVHRIDGASSQTGTLISTTQTYQGDAIVVWVKAERGDISGTSCAVHVQHDPAPVDGVWVDFTGSPNTLTSATGLSSYKWTALTVPALASAIGDPMRVVLRGTISATNTTGCLFDNAMSAETER